MIDKGGVFSSPVVEYVVETLPMKWRVLRRYDDVLWLKEQIQRFFPGVIVNWENIIVATIK